jgi:hypothetical protein
MGKCKLKMVTQCGVNTYTCQEIRLLEKGFKDYFREANLTNEIQKLGKNDRYYQSYSRQIKEFLDECRCKGNESI